MSHVHWVTYLLIYYIYIYSSVLITFFYVCKIKALLRQISIFGCGILLS